MPRKSAKKLGLAVGVAGLMMAGPAVIPGVQAADRLKGGDDGCPQASAAGALKTIAAAQTDYNSSQPKKKATKKKAAKRKAIKKAATKKAAARGPTRKVRKKATKKAATRRAPGRRNPC